jgi:hypothetical protein
LLQQELEAASESGIEVERVSKIPLDTWNSGDALRFANQGQFHPLKVIFINLILSFSSTLSG